VRIAPSSSAAFKATVKQVVDKDLVSAPPLSSAEISGLPASVRKAYSEFAAKYGSANTEVCKLPVPVEGGDIPVSVVEGGDDTGITWKAYSSEGALITSETTNEVKG
jgi:hypothetical protein